MEGEITLNVIQCYALTNENNEDNKAQRYERLQSTVEKCPGKDLTIVIGDLIAQIVLTSLGMKIP